MAASAAFLARARTDARDWLVEADEPLASLQLRSGGELPGIVATPALLELVRKARRYGLKLARAIEAQDDREQVTAWVEVEPETSGDRERHARDDHACDKTQTKQHGDRPQELARGAHDFRLRGTLVGAPSAGTARSE